MKLVLHPATQDAVEQFLVKPGHALLIEGPSGAGKSTLAAYIATQLLDIEPEALNHYPFFQLVTTTEKTISIDVIRDVQRFMRLKTLGTERAIRRILIVQDAQYLTVEAQNAFLKLLEEPPADTIIIMTTVNQSALLPTIRSRAQHLRVNVPSQASLVSWYGQQGIKKTEIDKAYYMSEGHVGLMSALLIGDEAHPLVAQIQIAKKLLSLTAFERLTMVDQLTKQRIETEQLLQALQLICHAGLIVATEQGQLAVTKRWHNSLRKLTGAEQSYQANPNLKLLMTDLLLGL